MSQNPLGQASEYSLIYDPGLLFAVARQEARAPLLSTTELPFTGVDIWNAWELTWLNARGKPVVATAEFRFDAASPNIIESKSLKLYLNSLAMTRYDDSEAVADVLRSDLAAVVGHPVDVSLHDPSTWGDAVAMQLQGICLDDIDCDCDVSTVDPTLLKCGSENTASQTLYSHAFRSNCPVTNQPDMGSVLVRYAGDVIDRGGLLRYLASYRQHNAFHESCVERIFVDILTRCAPTQLTVHALFNRRGGLDINPFRSNFENAPGPGRLWRQ